MKFSTIFVAAAAQVASAHYFFETNVINGAAQTPGKYVRDTTRQTKYNPIKFSSNPAGDIRDGSYADGPDIRCNQGAFSNAGRTEVLTVNAGSEVTAKLAYGAKMEHPGPGFVYMSRAPGDNVKAYDGSGDWFKIFEEGVCNQGADFTRDAWCTWGRDTITAKIPDNTPNGEYLVRFEHIGIHRSHVNQPEHYTSCLQVKVQNGGNGSPSPTFKLPGGYKDSDPYAKFSIYGGYKNFPMPGPAVWNGAGNGGGGGEPSNPGNGGGCSAMYGQCGGNGWGGAKCCSAGSCQVVNEWYHQCV
ncbi:Polysaccharide monooxygenase Cel61a 4 [Emericellopsis cladophorae]|uniref:lytic cellulose monooxygenase (C4-dehydrogenating) n=1 Tax=Emericellopsis cladophorae TaxID=2686198 RepID=A0A9P9Y9D7_9HYPO|nr:Polysaccharide monooxygenase Cel61a 4 [Emericellopsis cladophorae]KAI6785983.1 Polysaccharide monooxygenase Cel61a 4 [Emericellopsis cladophorae]